jgi:hypothetical protein
MKLQEVLNEQDDQDLPSSGEVLGEVEDMLRAVAARSSKYQTKDSSSPSAPDSSKFRASHSGKVEFAENVTTHGYGGFETKYVLALKIGTAIGSSNVEKVMQDVESEFEGLAIDNGAEGHTIKTSDGKRITLRDSSGSNYVTMGVSVS